MACGTVAVTGNNTSLPEVVGDGGILLDATDEGQWIECILQLARGTIDRQTLIRRGLAQVGRFSWDITAEKHIHLYKTIAG
jgi:glycosyltransferase involved in cell wall biosynthesis